MKKLLIIIIILSNFLTLTGCKDSYYKEEVVEMTEDLNNESYDDEDDLDTAKDKNNPEDSNGSNKEDDEVNEKPQQDEITETEQVGLKLDQFNSTLEDGGFSYLPINDEEHRTTLLEWGRQPVLGIRNLHNEGVTGRGVSVAYIDQSLRISHEALDGKSIYYDYVNIRNSEIDLWNSMHGIAVTDLLFGAAPEVNLYYIAHPTFLMDQSTHAKAIYKVLEINETLALDEKIRVIGFSDNIDDSELNKDAFEEAVEVANENGIVVFFANNDIVTIKESLDRDEPSNYEFNSYHKSDKLAFPTTYVTGNTDSDRHYTFWESGDTSWTTPVQVGLAALALQVNPNLDPFSIEELMLKSAYNIDGNKLINPKGFIDLVKNNKAESQYYYVLLYNSLFANTMDLEAINDYSKSLINDETDVKIIDVKNFDTAQGILSYLKKVNTNTNLILKGIQIFGSREEVPTFMIHDKVNMDEYGIHDYGTIYTDHFYSNFKNDASKIDKNLSMYTIFEENEIDINFYPEWDLARLPLGEGEICDYYNRYLEYKELTNNKRLPLVSFSNPIFASRKHSDDLGTFILRLDKHFGILSDDDYKLYGNLKGNYPVSNPVLGGFEPENIEYENEQGIVNFVINSHGQFDNIDNAYFIGTSGEIEVRKSFLNNINVNRYLDNNYFNLFLWDCWGAAQLNDENITQLMLSEGKAINVIASSYITSNSGIDVYAPLNELKGNNGVSLFYGTMKGIYLHNLSWSESFMNAKRIYISNSLDSRYFSEGNYQFNLNNSLALHYFGLLENTSKDKVNNITITDESPLHNISK
ncbi:hypothetical protein RI065_00485 [Mycoplasmatota bacterium zrk1]